VLNFHSRRFDENPDEEVPFLAKLITEYRNTPIVVAGDFNLPSDHLIFQNFSRIGLYPTLTNQPTTLKRKCPSTGIDIYLNHPIDHIFFSTQFFRLIETGIVDFVRSCTRLTEARMISDHVPIWMQMGLSN
jgi:endonuclease/exonuclease/phosphatase family metal-dependent hydrolase